MSTNTLFNYRFDIHPEADASVQDRFWSFGIGGKLEDLKKGIAGLVESGDNPGQVLTYIKEKTERDDIDFGSSPFVQITMQFCYAATGQTEKTPYLLVQGYSGTGLITVTCPSIQDMAAIPGNTFGPFTPKKDGSQAFRALEPEIAYFHIEPTVAEVEIAALTTQILMNPLGFCRWLNEPSRIDPDPKVLQNGTTPVEDKIKTHRRYDAGVNDGAKYPFCYTVHTAIVPAGFREMIPMQCIKGSGPYTVGGGTVAVSTNQVQQTRWFTEDPMPPSPDEMVIDSSHK